MLMNANDRKIPEMDPINMNIRLNVAPTVGDTNMIAIITARFGDTMLLEILVMKIKIELITHAFQIFFLLAFFFL